MLQVDLVYSQLADHGAGVKAQRAFPLASVFGVAPPIPMGGDIGFSALVEAQCSLLCRDGIHLLCLALGQRVLLHGQLTPALCRPLPRVCQRDVTR